MNRHFDPQHFAEAIAHWLAYQSLSGSSALFCEGYLSQPVFEFLERHCRGEVKPELTHPNVEPRQAPGAKSSGASSSRGRPRQIDFVAFKPEKTSEVDVAIELKWVGAKSEDDAPTRTGSSLTVQRVINDVLRLEQLKGAAVSRYFVLAGARGHMETVFPPEGVKASQTKQRAMIRTILPLSTAKTLIKVRECDEPLRQYFAFFAKQYQSCSSDHEHVLPKSFHVALAADVPLRYQGERGVRVMIWKVDGAGKGGGRFDPSTEWAGIKPKEATDELVEENEEAPV